MTDVTLKEHLQSQINWLDRYFVDQIKAIDAKTALAKADIDVRLQGMNEFRDTLRDQASRLATKDSLEALEIALSNRLQALELKDAKLAGMAAAVSLVVSALVALAVKFF
jgi:hypothetical protein